MHLFLEQSFEILPRAHRAKRHSLKLALAAGLGADVLGLKGLEHFVQTYVGNATHDRLRGIVWAQPCCRWTPSWPWAGTQKIPVP